ncbi:MAG: cell division protein FtsZ [Colwellia sp.]|nr:cell division FtsZ family protein [Colwellia sp.]NQZ81668.1 cell division protein FtsZ [Colwellia sp.]
MTKNEIVELMPSVKLPLISVIGIGGCGGNTIDYLFSKSQVESEMARYLGINTDSSSLSHIKSHGKLLIGEALTSGFGAGADPEIGLKAAKESEEQIRAFLEKSSVVIIVCGLGGGTGTGASPFISQLAKEMDIPVIAVATLPFRSEGKLRCHYAKEGVIELKKSTDACILLENDLLISALNKEVGLFSAFEHSNRVLYNLVLALIELLSGSGIVNVDLKDFSKVLGFQGDSVLGVGKAESEDSIIDALENAINNPLVSQVDISDAAGVIIHLCCKNEPSLKTYEAILHHIENKLTHKLPLIISGVTQTQNIDCELEILILATGISEINSENRTEKALTFNDTGKEVEQADYLDIPAFIRKNT